MNPHIKALFENLRTVEAAHPGVNNSMTIRIVYELICEKLILNNHNLKLPEDFGTMTDEEERKLRNAFYSLFCQPIDGTIADRFKDVHKLIGKNSLLMLSKGRIKPFKSLKELRDYYDREDLAIAA